MERKSCQIKTRQKVNCVVFGAPQEFNDLLLPTYEDVMKFYLSVKQDLKPSASSKEPTVGEIGENVAKKLEELWFKASIPIVSHSRILQMIRNYHDKYKGILKSYKNRGGRDNYKSKLQKFKQMAKKIFDISACKCKDLNFCSCSSERRVPAEERLFLLDQRSGRKMVIGSVDIKKTKQLNKRIKRKLQEQSRISKSEKKRPSASSEVSVSSESKDSETGTDTDSQPEILKPIRREAPTQMRMRLSNLAKACDRTGVSDRSAAAIASAVLEDVGLIKKHDKDKVIDRMKIRRQRKQVRSNIQQSLSEGESRPRGLYFDGRKDNTLVQEKKGIKNYRKSITEEHYVLVQEPGSKYIGHVTPSTGSAEAISKSIFEFLEIASVDTSDLSAVGCDGTVINTGRKGGVIRRLEMNLNRPLQWFICQLHANELPFRHLFEYIDGSTAGPKSFSGPIGKQLEHCRNLSVARYKPVKGNLPTVDILVAKALSTDQKYLLNICHAIESGRCSFDLAQRNPGKISHARWLTTANRILRMYIGTSVPSNQLKVLVTFVLKVYAPMWFSIKMHPSCKDGAKHLFKTIELSRYLSEDLRNVIDPVIQRNGYFAHAENILLCMISDDRQHIRELGIRRLLKARTQRNDRKIRIFTVPEINFKAKEYFNLIGWAEITEPPLMFHISDENLRSMVLNNKQDIAAIDFPRFPCHTQAVERCVKVVTEASAAVCDADSRDGFIRVRLESRNRMPSFSKKSAYKTAV